MIICLDHDKQKVELNSIIFFLYCWIFTSRCDIQLWIFWLIMIRTHTQKKSLRIWFKILCDYPLIETLLFNPPNYWPDIKGEFLCCQNRCQSSHLQSLPPYMSICLLSVKALLFPHSELIKISVNKPLFLLLPPKWLIYDHHLIHPVSDEHQWGRWDETVAEKGKRRINVAFFRRKHLLDCLICDVKSQVKSLGWIWKSINKVGLDTTVK